MMKYLKIQNKLVCAWEHLEDRIKAAALSFVVLILTFALFIGGRTILANDEVPIRLVVYAFSTQEEVLTQGIFPAFERKWEAETGRDLIVESLFGPSGTLAGQINIGAPADVAILSNERHVNLLKFGKQIEGETQPVVVSSTPIIIATRPENPAGINEFADLAQPGLQLIHADPHTSGVGEWAILAEYGSAFLDSGYQPTAEKQLMDIWSNVRLLGSSARSTLTLFEMGAGDALVTYEQVARLALERGVPLEIVIPSRTIIAQHVAVIVDKNVTSFERLVAEDFIQYLLSDTGQNILYQYHQRSADPEDNRFPRLIHPFTAEDIGGWSHAYEELILTLWQREIEPRLDLESISVIQSPGE
jgi:ABC-type sulfate transport system substrate-binding protein